MNDWTEKDRRQCREHSFIATNQIAILDSHVTSLREWGWMSGVVIPMSTLLYDVINTLNQLDLALKNAAQAQTDAFLTEALKKLGPACRRLTRYDTQARDETNSPPENLYPDQVVAAIDRARNTLQATARLATMIQRDLTGWTKRGLLKT